VDAWRNAQRGKLRTVGKYSIGKMRELGINFECDSGKRLAIKETNLPKLLNCGRNAD
jgi:hypothetical protein